MGRLAGVPFRSTPYGRLRVALAGSAFLHALGASTLFTDVLPGQAPGSGRPVPLTVRLDTAPAAPETKPAVAPRQGPGLARRSRAGHTASAVECCSGPHRPLPAYVDATIYPAGELDSLPVPVTPLDLARLPELTRPIRLELTIDEHGTVYSISIGASPPPEEKELRRLIAATLFVPARKDGRAVKSRIVLGVQ